MMAKLGASHTPSKDITSPKITRASPRCLFPMEPPHFTKSSTSTASTPALRQMALSAHAPSMEGGHGMFNVPATQLRVILSAVDCMAMWLVAQMVLCIGEIPLAKGQPSTDHWMVASRGLNTPSPRLLGCSRVGMPTRSRLRWMKGEMCTRLGSEPITSHGTPTRVTKVRLGVSR